MGWPFDVHCTDTSVARVTVRRHRVEVHTRAARERSRQPRDVMHLASLATRTVGGTSFPRTDTPTTVTWWSLSSLEAVATERLVMH